VLAQTNGFLLKSGQNPTNYPRFQPYDTGYKTAEYEVNSLNKIFFLQCEKYQKEDHLFFNNLNLKKFQTYTSFKSNHLTQMYLE
jgi:hypothetical protein